LCRLLPNKQEGTNYSKIWLVNEHMYKLKQIASDS
jgi:hypothetical protein